MVSRKLCTGCAACMNICPMDAITMCTDKEGFLYPYIYAEKCVNCGLCNDICPVDKQCKGEMRDDVIYAAYNLDKNVRYQSSSGGSFTVLAEYILHQGGLVVGCAMTEDCYAAEHIIVDNIKDLYKLRGSKYIQSNVGSVLRNVKEALKSGQKVLFTGTPCQIAGVREYVGQDLSEGLFLVDVICHGAPSPLVWRKYIKEIEETIGEKSREVNFRCKEKGWKEYTLKIDFEKHESYKGRVSEDLYLKGFIGNYFLRSSCYNCNFKGQNYFSDMTLGDFWGVHRIYPEYTYDKGISVIVAHTEKANLLISEIKEQCKVMKVSYTENALKSNPSYYNSVSQNALRKYFMRDIRRKRAFKVLEKYCSAKFSSRVRRKISRIFNK